MAAECFHKSSRQYLQNTLFWSTRYSCVTSLCSHISGESSCCSRFGACTQQRPAECCALQELTTLAKPLTGGDEVHPVCELSPDQSLDPQVYVTASLLPPLTTQSWEKCPHYSPIVTEKQGLCPWFSSHFLHQAIFVFSLLPMSLFPINQRLLQGHLAQTQWREFSTCVTQAT